MRPVAGAARPDGEISARRSLAASRPLNHRQPAVVAQSRAHNGGERGKLALNAPHESALGGWGVGGAGGGGAGVCVGVWVLGG